MEKPLKKLALYTALFGEFDELCDPFGHLDGMYHFNGGGVDRFYFTLVWHYLG